MARLLVISDIHNRWKEVATAIKGFNYDKIVFLGDIIDNRRETLKDIEETCLWFNEKIQDPNFIWLAGNHDLQYIYPQMTSLQCGNYSLDKQTIFDDIVGENRNRHRLFHYENDILFSHAGFQYDIVNESPNNVKNLEEVLISYLQNSIDNKSFRPGIARSGYEYKGGFTWLDFDEEFEVVEGLNQIVGHTFQYTEEPNIKRGMYSVNICLDTANEHYIISEEKNIYIYTKKHKLYDHIS